MRKWLAIAAVGVVLAGLWMLLDRTMPPPDAGREPGRPGPASRAVPTVVALDLSHSRQPRVSVDMAARRDEMRRVALADPRWAECEDELGIPPVFNLGDPAVRRDIVARLERMQRAEKQAVTKLAQQSGRPMRGDAAGVTWELIGFSNGRPYAYETFNANAAISTAADLVRQTPPYNLDGSGLTVGVWDGGAVRPTHQEFGGRVTKRDGAANHYHATHVGGTIGAAGVVANVKGMAPAVLVDSYDWNNDVSEMASRAMSYPGEPGTIQISNHSYGTSAGWSSATGAWWGMWGNRESDVFGSYSAEAAITDTVCYNAAYYLPFKSAGNDRNDGPFSPFQYYDNGWKQKSYNSSTDPYSDGWDNGGYDTIPSIGNAKNVMTVGAVSHAVTAGARDVSKANAMSFSSWGPSDDGRVKPDMVADGDWLYSTDSGHDTDYRSLQGTSMSSPNAAGSALLLVEHYAELFGGNIGSSTLKGLILHTADDLWNEGPDYRYGWGLMNTEAAADLLMGQAEFPDAVILREGTRGGRDDADTYPFLWDGASPIKATICWTDPPGTGRWDLDDRRPVLVNDLDLRVVDPVGDTNFPYVLSATSPAAVATRADNIVDNVEQVYIAAPPTAGVYTVHVNHKGALFSGIQEYALWIGGGMLPPSIEHTPLTNTTGTNDPYVVDATITSMESLNTNELWICWNTNGSTSGFSSSALVLVSNDLYRAGIPAQPVDTTTHYYLSARTINGWSALSPSTAPAALYAFTTTDATSLVVTGQPAMFGIAEPGYGAHAMPAGIVVAASASQNLSVGEGHRWSSAGWTGTGSVPASGNTNAVSFTLDGNSELAWQWQEEYALAQTSSVPGLWGATTWWTAVSTAETVHVSSTLDGGATGYRFTEWRVDGLRQPDTTNQAVNPATHIGMSTSRVVTAVYLPSDEDADGDGLSDWWERFYFGSTNVTGGADDDGDGAANTNEFLDGTDPRDSESVPQPPGIVHTPLENPQIAPAPWTANAIITDNSTVAGATLYWRRNGGGWQNASMSAGGGGLYTAPIAAPGVAGDSFDYWMRAADASGNETSNSVNTFSVSYPISSVTATSFCYVVLVGGTTNDWLSITNWGTTDLVWSVTYLAEHLNENVETGTNKWTHGGANDRWHVSTRRASSGAQAWYCGLPTGGYAASSHATLDTPPLSLGSNALLTFQHWIDSELSYANYAWDGAIVEVSTNLGVSFTQIPPLGGYPYLIHPHMESPWGADTGCFAGTGGWQQATFDLAVYAGQQTLLRFHFGSDGATQEEGWYVDDIRVTSPLSSNEWVSVSPHRGMLMRDTGDGILLSVDSSGILPGDDSTAIIRFTSNDPGSPTNTVTVQLKPRTIPSVQLHSAAQTSTDGRGYVVVTNRVIDLDGDACALELFASTNAGVTWFALTADFAEASFGSVTVSNGHPQVQGVATMDAYVAMTNGVAVAWGTTNHPAVLLSTGTLVRARAWDGRFWSAAVTSAPFLVDNEMPTQPGDLTVSSHTVGQWSTNRVVDAQWSAASDGGGVGVAGYAIRFTNAPGQTGSEMMAGGTAVSSAPLGDGANWWVSVRAMDHFGNTSLPTNAGAFSIDATPPAVAGADVIILTSEAGLYIVGTAVTSTWSGFTDALSGITGYYYGPTDASPTTNGAWTTVQTGVVSGAAVILNQTNAVYVWPRDVAGMIGAAAAESILVLDPDTDYDGDGLLNGEEEIAGTDAAARDSVLAINAATNVTTTNGPSVVFTWPSVSGRWYSIYQRPALSGGPPWTAVAAFTNIPGAGGTMSYTDALYSVTTRFYRVGVRR